MQSPSPPTQIEILKTAGPVWDEAVLRPKSTVSTGHVLRHHDQGIGWRHEGYGYYTAHEGRASDENENMTGVISSAGSSSGLSFVISFESGEVIETDANTKTIAMIQALDPRTTTFSPTEISFLHLVVGWLYYTQTQSSLDRVEKYLSDIIRELRTRGAHAQVLLPRFLDLVREAQYLMSTLWPEETEGLSLEEQRAFAADRAAMHLRATRGMEGLGNIGGVPVDWKTVERGFEDVDCKEIIRGRPVISTESTPEVADSRQRSKLFEWSKDLNRDCPLAYSSTSLITAMQRSRDETINTLNTSEAADPEDGVEVWLNGTDRQRILPTPSSTSTRRTPDTNDTAMPW